MQQEKGLNEPFTNKMSIKWKSEKLAIVALYPGLTYEVMRSWSGPFENKYKSVVFSYFNFVSFLL